MVLYKLDSVNFNVFIVFHLCWHLTLVIMLLITQYVFKTLKLFYAILGKIMLASLSGRKSVQGLLEIQKRSDNTNDWYFDLIVFFKVCVRWKKDEFLLSTSSFFPLTQTLSKTNKIEILVFCVEWLIVCFKKSPGGLFPPGKLVVSFLNVPQQAFCFFYKNQSYYNVIAI